jgi:hypothetical protein
MSDSEVRRAVMLLQRQVRQSAGAIEAMGQINVALARALDTKAAARLRAQLEEMRPAVEAEEEFASAFRSVVDRFMAEIEPGR